MSAGPGSSPEPDDGCELSVRVPDRVIHRVFGDELVVLNLHTGQYHGLNATARRMFELVIERSGTDGVAAEMASEYDVPRAELAADVRALCRQLSDRGLLEVEAAS